jgi:hypothetical protein
MIDELLAWQPELPSLEIDVLAAAGRIPDMLRNFSSSFSKDDRFGVLFRTRTRRRMA